MLKKDDQYRRKFYILRNNPDVTMVDGYPVRDKIEYIIAFINEFGKRFGLTDSQAYRYLNTYGAIKNIDKHYGALHTQDFRGNVEDVATYCRRMGGQL